VIMPPLVAVRADPHCLQASASAETSSEFSYGWPNPACEDLSCTARVTSQSALAARHATARPTQDPGRRSLRSQVPEREG
jgi:hypothetical protein